jgi:hypothetical protein
MDRSRFRLRETQTKRPIESRSVKGAAAQLSDRSSERSFAPPVEIEPSVAPEASLQPELHNNFSNQLTTAAASPGNTNLRLKDKRFAQHLMKIYCVVSTVLMISIIVILAFMFNYMRTINNTVARSKNNNSALSQQILYDCRAVSELPMDCK